MFGIQNRVNTNRLPGFDAVAEEKAKASKAGARAKVFELGPLSSQQSCWFSQQMDVWRLAVGCGIR